MAPYGRSVTAPGVYRFDTIQGLPQNMVFELSDRVSLKNGMRQNLTPSTHTHWLNNLGVNDYQVQQKYNGSSSIHHEKITVLSILSSSHTSITDEKHLVIDYFLSVIRSSRRPPLSLSSRCCQSKIYPLLSPFSGHSYYYRNIHF